MTRSTTGRLLTIAWLTVIALATLLPIPSQEILSARTPWYCVLCGPRGTADFVLNVVLFVPLGVGLVLMGVRPVLAAVACLGLTLGVETLQLTLVPGRDAALGDVIANTGGGLLGVLGAANWGALASPAAHASVPLRLAAAALPVACTAFTLAGFKPSAPEATWYGQWEARYETDRWFGGKVSDARLSGHWLPNGQMRQSDIVHASVRQEPVLLQAEFESGGVDQAGAIVRLSDSVHTILTLSQGAGRALLYSIRGRAADLGLNDATFRLGEALPMVTGEPVTATGSYRAGQVLLLTVHASGQRESRIHLSPAHGWAQLLPLAIGNDLRTRLLMVLWMGLLFVPMGWFGSRSGWTVVAGLGLGTLCLAVLPLWMGFPLAGAEGWVGGALGLFGGQTLWVLQAPLAEATPKAKPGSTGEPGSQ